jgi:ABC-2 type transport system permease protein
MNDLAAMIWVESRKALRSRVPLFTAVGALFMPLGVAFLIFVATNPEVGRRLGLVSAKANLMAYASTGWATYFELTAQIIAAGGFFIFCLIICWVFGREFVDGTLKDLLAVPVPRASIVLAKFLVFAAWCAALAGLIFAASLVTGGLMGLPGGSAAVVLQGAVLDSVTAVLVITVVLPFALLASIGRGYLLPIGATIFALITANVLAALGWGAYFPWGVPGLFAQAKGDLVPLSYPIAILTGIAGALGAYLWWKYADQPK